MTAPRPAMKLHLIKLCVGINDVDHLVEAHERRLREMSRAGAEPRLWHATRNTPRRAAELLDGGSLYWVIKGRTAVRQRLAGIESAVDSDGRRLCRLMLDPLHVETVPWPHRPFQGWRYLEPAGAPPDLAGIDPNLSPEMAVELRELGLI